MKIKSLFIGFSLLILITGCPTGPDESEDKLKLPFYGTWEFTTSIYQGSEIFEEKNYSITFYENDTFNSNFSFFWNTNTISGKEPKSGTWDVKTKYTYWGTGYPRLDLTSSGETRSYRASIKNNKLFWLSNTEKIDSLCTWVKVD